MMMIGGFRFSWNFHIVPKLMSEELCRSLKFFVDASIELAVLPYYTSYLQPSFAETIEIECS